MLLERDRRSEKIEIENAQKVREHSLTLKFSPASFFSGWRCCCCCCTAAVVVVGNDWPEDLATELA